MISSRLLKQHAVAKDIKLRAALLCYLVVAVHQEILACKGRRQHSVAGARPVVIPQQHAHDLEVATRVDVEVRPAVQLVYALAFPLLPVAADRRAPLWLPTAAFALGGAGFGGLLTVTLLNLLVAVPHEARAVATAASYAFP